jgi:Flp pilus assembly protein TadB
MVARVSCPALGGPVDSRSSHSARPVLITDAQQSRIDEHNSRRKRYTLTMGLRIVCLILAAIFYKIVWLMAILVVLACVLPWMAFLIANDRPPKRAERINRFGHPAPDRALGSATESSRIIDG